MKHRIILRKTIGSYGHDADGAPWASFLIESGVVCAECGTKIRRGWQRGRVGEELLKLCDEHVEFVEDNKEQSS